ncbi:MAG: SprB repeat-containing protein, partial [Bacteroidales bacterium]|nr:SprB repeat-containing protein [Bacteroidales bacterium]
MKRLIHILLPFFLFLTCSNIKVIADDVTISVAVQNVTCNGYENGEITIQFITGTGNYDYRLYKNDWPWNGGQRIDSILNTGLSSFTFTNLDAGTYYIIVEDVHGDPGFAMRQVTQPARLEITSITIYKGISCSDACDGELLAHVTGGTKPYTYIWSIIPGGTLPDTDSIAVNLCQGVYKCEINDANNCGSPVLPSKSFPFVESNPFARDSIADPLAGGTVGTTQTVCHNDDVPAFTSSAPATGGSGSFTYTWQYSTTSAAPGSGSWTDIPSSNS